MLTLMEAISVETWFQVSHVISLSYDKYKKIFKKSDLAGEMLSR